MARNTNAISEKKPWRSLSMGCDPKDIKQHKEDLKRHGVKNVDFDKDGHLICYSRKSRADAARVYGMVDREGGFGDYTGR